MRAPVTVGVSLKMYFGHRQTREWSATVARLVRSRPAVADGRVEVFVVPSYPAILPALEAFRGSGVLIGAQDLATEDSGPFTGEVSGAELAEIGVRVVEVGHAERRRLYGETDAIVAAKTAAALRNGLTPVVCVGETERADAAAALAESLGQLRSALASAGPGRVIVAYEPVWAIGSTEPASTEHISIVARGLRAELADDPDRAGSTVVYGGSAGPGLLTALAGAVDGIFLGRFAHDPDALAGVLDEAVVLSAPGNTA